MRERRRQYYTDRKIQGYLLAVIIALEVALVVGLLLVLHSEISQVIESHLYRIHQPQEGAWPEIFQLLGQILIIFCVVNMAMFLMIHFWWGHFIKRIVVHFSETLNKIVNQDFHAPGAGARPLHRVSVLVDTWFEKEQQRHQQVLRLLHSIEQTANGPLSKAEQAVIRERLGEIHRVVSG